MQTFMRTLKVMMTIQNLLHVTIITIETYLLLRSNVLLQIFMYSFHQMIRILVPAQKGGILGP